jgi:membrane protein DedA with SNARE-associated domain
MVAAVIVGAVAAFASGSPGAGHHHSIGRLLAAIGISVAILTVTMAVTWRLVRHHAPSRRLMRSSWATRRRVGRALRKGQPIAEEDRETAHALIAFIRSRKWLPWLYVGCGAIQLLAAATNHGDIRWLQLGVGVAYLGLVPYWLWVRRKTLRREADLH